jgi:hypothetical protein
MNAAKKDNIPAGFAFTTDAHKAALYAKRRELGRDNLTKEEFNATVDGTNTRIEAGEDPLDILAEYTRQAEEHWTRGADNVRTKTDKADA